MKCEDGKIMNDEKTILNQKTISQSLKNAGEKLAKEKK
jgi:hypothetical protein